ncbi:MAG: winged helix-turn-helix domain-containing protein [Chloroflexota bacterium]
MQQRRYVATYRQKQMEQIAGWVTANESGAIVGLAGAGKSNFLRFLCHYPQALHQYLEPTEQKIILVPADLNNMPTYDLSTFYRVILRAFFEIQERFPIDLQPCIAEFYRHNQREQDPFLPQSALRELLFLFRAKQVKVILVMDRFDHFCESATPQMFDTLRGLRDDFKENLIYITGLRYEIAYLPEANHLGELHEVLDRNVCWIGAMAGEDAERVIREETVTGIKSPTNTEQSLLLRLTGGYPALLKATCHWWRTTPRKPAMRQWSVPLLAEPAITTRLREIWQGLTQEEQWVLSELQKLQPATTNRTPDKASTKAAAIRQAYRKLQADHHTPLTRLEAKGFCYPIQSQWRINGLLLNEFIAEIKDRSRGRVWWNDATQKFYQGATVLELAPQQQVILDYFLQHPRHRLTKTDILIKVWPDEWEEVNEASLYQLIRKLRQEIEPNPAQPCYITNWRGTPEGGYQFFPEGRGEAPA